MCIRDRFYDRVKKYAEALHQENPKAALDVVFSETLSVGGTAPEIGASEDSSFKTKMASYLQEFDVKLADATLGQIALTDFSFPSLSV